MSQSIGAKLKQARQEQEISLAQAAEATRVKLHYLEALEEDKLNALPSRVQGKGFLRIYAEFLGLPVQPLLDAWEGKTPTPLPPQPTTTPATPAAAEPPSAPLGAAREPISQPLPPPSPAEPPPSASLTIFKAIGFQLAERRKALGLSLEGAEHELKLRAANLQALEEGRISDLPSPVQARGMLSNYATFLGLNVEAVLLTFAEGLQLNRTERLPQPAASGRKSGRRPLTPQKGIRRFLTPDLLVGGSVILMLFFFAIWTASRINSERLSQLNETQLTVVADGFLTPGIPTVTPTRQFTPAAPPDGQTGVIPSEESLEPSATPTLPVIGSGPVQIYVIAHQRAWVRITADKREIFNGRIVPGNVYAYAAKDQIEFLTGNAAGVQIIFNQNDLGILGLPGQVYSLIFSLQGAVTPTPRFSPTPTPPPTATSTLPPTPTQPTPTVTQLIP